MPNPDEFVLDCSVAMAWCFDDEAILYTDGVRDSFQSDSVCDQLAS
jgi:hypothetical protein